MKGAIAQSWIVAAGSLVDFLAAIVIVYHVLWAMLGVVQRRGSDLARLRIAQGVLAALGFSVAGSLLKIIGLQTWPQIRLFAFVLALRTFLKRVFAWEEAQIASRLESSTSATAHASGISLPSTQRL